MGALRKHRPAEERRSDMVAAVIALAGERNPAEITTIAIAERLQLTQGAVFRHFPTKDAIWQAVMEWVADTLLDRLTTAVAGMDSPLGAMEAMFHRHLDFVAEYPGVPRILFGELQRRESSPAKATTRLLLLRYADLLGTQIRRGISVGEITTDTDPETASTVFVGLIQGLVMQSLLAADPTLPKARAAAVFACYRRSLECHA
jgi:AcrR family transcriptional regulator